MKGKGKATGSRQDQVGENDEDEEEDEEDEEVDEEENEDDDEEEKPVKEEVGRYGPRRGRVENKQPCEGCIKARTTCHTQDSIKARGACYECGRKRIKCMFTVREHTFI